jgi:hypothetical protein
MRPIRNVPSDYKNPSLRRWRVMEVVLQNGSCSRHVWGHDITNEAGRASSAIKQFNREDMTATTHSGRIYKLLGPPGNASRGEYAWQNWCRINGVVSESDVTGEYFLIDEWLAHPSIDEHKQKTN